MKKWLMCLVAAWLFLGLAAGAAAQFTGPTRAQIEGTVAQVKDARLGASRVFTGRLVAHLQEDYYLFRDDTGEIRVEIESHVWQGRKVDPEVRVRIRAEIDPGWMGRYLSVKSLEIVP